MMVHKFFVNWHGIFPSAQADNNISRRYIMIS